MRPGAGIARQMPTPNVTDRSKAIVQCCLTIAWQLISCALTRDARSAVPKNKGELKMEVAHFRRHIEVLVVYCACWDYRDPQLDTFSQGGWNMNDGDTKLSELSGIYKMQKSQLDFLILPVATLVGLDDATVVVTS